MSNFAPYGSWKSPITSDLIVSETIEFGQIALDGDDVYWAETRPSEGGRSVVVHRTPDGRILDATPPDFNVRTLVHEYGGGAFAVGDGTVYFSNYDDQRLYRQRPGRRPHPLTPLATMRYADGDVDQLRGRMVCVREDHSTAASEAVTTVVSIDLKAGGVGEVLASGNDFYSSPRMSPDGSRLAWVAWDHPNMPWDGTELWIAELDAGGTVTESRLVAGGDDESVLEPRWSPEGELYFVSDRTGWWNLYRGRGGEAEPVCPLDVEFAVTPWRFGASTYAFESAGRIVCAYNRQGVWRLATIDTKNGHLEDINTQFADVSRLGIHATPGRAVVGAGSPGQLPRILEIDLDAGKTRVLRRSSDVSVGRGDLSRARSIEFPTEHGLTAHAFFYAPKNSEYEAPAGEKPPLIVVSHGGPTGATTTSLKLNVQFWTTRGIAVLDVNYGGSTGYGTAYRRRLNGQWGVVDVDDCVNGVKYLVDLGEVDPDRVAIKGGSAGGYTTLSALTFRDTFKAGASHFGISDLEALTRDTHKFESRYLDTMIGPYPDRRDLYVERSPIHHTQGLSCPVILFQGLEDKVVPPNQAEMMVDALHEKGIPVAYLPFEGEQHGFRKAENIKRALDAEIYFFSTVFGFELAEPVEPVHIENLD